MGAAAKPWKFYRGQETHPTADLIKPWEPSRPGARLHVLSLGMGLESVYIAVRYCLQPRSRVMNGRRFDLRDLVVVTAMTGDEKGITADLMRKFILPLFAKHGVRYIQAGRRGHLKQAGIAIFDDSHHPTELYPEGIYTLKQHLTEIAGIPVAAKGSRRCSTKFKGEVLDAVIEQVANGQPFTHAIGYNFDEQRRIEGDRKASEKTNAALKRRGLPVLREASFPMSDWKEGRDVAKDYLRKVFGPVPTIDGYWPKSCCEYCAFIFHFSKAPEDADQNEEAFQEWLENPGGALIGLQLELRSLAFNERQSFFASGRLIDLLSTDDRFHEILAKHEALNDEPIFGIYRVRQISGINWRKIERIRQDDGSIWRGTKSQMTFNLESMGIVNEFKGEFTNDPDDVAARWVTMIRPVKEPKKKSRKTRQSEEEVEADFDTVWLHNVGDDQTTSGVESNADVPGLADESHTTQGVCSEMYVVAIEGALDKSRKGFDGQWAARMNVQPSLFETVLDESAGDISPVSARNLSLA